MKYADTAATIVYSIWEPQPPGALTASIGIIFALPHREQRRFHYKNQQFNYVYGYLLQE
jgi:hypothetical protein